MAMKRTLAEQLEAGLRSEILMGELKPGTRLRAEEIALRYGVSHTPIREALRSLAADSLVSIDPHAGAQVARATLADLRDVYRVRLFLEPEALQLSVANGDAEWAKELSSALQSLVAEYRHRGRHPRDAALARAEAHRRFDQSLFAACGSEWLLRLVRTMSTHSERYRVVLRSARGIERDLEHEHREIAEAALDRDVPGAISALEAHLRRSFELTELQLIESTGA
jgi:DNA-binding GntR family transcriptional regulator